MNRKRQLHCPHEACSLVEMANTYMEKSIYTRASGGEKGYEKVEQTREAE